MNRTILFLFFILFSVSLIFGQVPNEAEDEISIATFNIQVFGKSKSNNTIVMQILSDIIRIFDFVTQARKEATKSQVLQAKYIEKHRENFKCSRLDIKLSKEQDKLAVVKHEEDFLNMGETMAALVPYDSLLNTQAISPELLFDALQTIKDQER